MLTWLKREMERSRPPTSEDDEVYIVSGAEIPVRKAGAVISLGAHPTSVHFALAQLSVHELSMGLDMTCPVTVTYTLDIQLGLSNPPAVSKVYLLPFFDSTGVIHRQRRSVLGRAMAAQAHDTLRGQKGVYLLGDERSIRAAIDKIEPFLGDMFSICIGEGVLGVAQNTPVSGSMASLAREAGLGRRFTLPANRPIKSG